MKASSPGDQNPEVMQERRARLRTSEARWRSPLLTERKADRGRSEEQRDGAGDDSETP